MRNGKERGNENMDEEIVEVGKDDKRGNRS